MFSIIKTFLTALFACFGLLSLQAHAELPAAVTAAITEAQVDGETLGYAMLVMAIIVGLVFWLKRKGGN